VVLSTHQDLELTNLRKYRLLPATERVV